MVCPGKLKLNCDLTSFWLFCCMVFLAVNSRTHAESEVDDTWKFGMRNGAVFVDESDLTDEHSTLHQVKDIDSNYQNSAEISKAGHLNEELIGVTQSDEFAPDAHSKDVPTSTPPPMEEPPLSQPPLHSDDQANLEGSGDVEVVHMEHNANVDEMVSQESIEGIRKMADSEDKGNWVTSVDSNPQNGGRKSAIPVSSITKELGNQEGNKRVTGGEYEEELNGSDTGINQPLNIQVDNDLIKELGSEIMSPESNSMSEPISDQVPNGLDSDLRSDNNIHLSKGDNFGSKSDTHEEVTTEDVTGSKYGEFDPNQIVGTGLGPEHAGGGVEDEERVKVTNDDGIGVKDKSNMASEGDEGEDTVTDEAINRVISEEDGGSEKGEGNRVSDGGNVERELIRAVCEEGRECVGDGVREVTSDGGGSVGDGGRGVTSGGSGGSGEDKGRIVTGDKDGGSLEDKGKKMAAEGDKDPKTDSEDVNKSQACGDLEKPGEGSKTSCSHDKKDANEREEKLANESDRNTSHHQKDSDREINESVYTKESESDSNVQDTSCKDGGELEGCEKAVEVGNREKGEEIEPVRKDEEVEPVEGNKEVGAVDGDKEMEDEEDDQVLTFEEFKKKMREQGEGQGQRPGVEEVIVPGSKKATTHTNYASFDCGAKVIETNPETQNSMAILLENKDAYMINPCSADIMFVIELCEMVSIRTLEIACFELFSSIPESFKVYSSESYPDAEWNCLGQFEASNERKVHSFPLATEENVYAKFIKVEMISYYGEEHYCPLSLLRVLGASMMEVYEESQQKSHGGNGLLSAMLPPSEGFGEDDDLVGGVDNSVGENGELLRAAKDVVLRVLKKPLTLLGKMNGYIKHEDENEPPSIPTPENNPLEENSPPEDNPPLGEAPPLALTPEETPSINGGSNDDGTKSEETGDLGVVLESPLLETGEHQGERLNEASSEDWLLGEDKGGTLGRISEEGNTRGLVAGVAGVADDVTNKNDLPLSSLSNEDMFPSDSTTHERATPPLNPSVVDNAPVLPLLDTDTESLKPSNHLHGMTDEKSQDDPSPRHLNKVGDDLYSVYIDPAPVQSLSSHALRRSQLGSKSPDLRTNSLGPEYLDQSTISVYKSISLQPLGPKDLDPDSTHVQESNSITPEIDRELMAISIGNSFDSSDGVKSSVSETNTRTGSALPKPDMGDIICDNSCVDSRDTRSSTTADETITNQDEDRLNGATYSTLTFSETNSMEHVIPLAPDVSQNVDTESGSSDSMHAPLHNVDNGRGDRSKGERRCKDDIDSVHSTIEEAAGSSNLPVSSKTPNMADPAEQQRIPLSNGTAEINVDVDSVPLATEPSTQGVQLPKDSSLPAWNVTSDQVASGNSTQNQTTSQDPIARNSDLGTKALGIDNGNVTVSLNEFHDEFGNENRSDVDVGSVHSGANFKVGINQTASVENQTEVESDRNGTLLTNGSHSGSGTGSNGYGLPAQQREKSVFLRLSNNIEDLQANMTLFSIFLDQISSSLKKNKNKTEETTKWLDKRITSLNESILDLKKDVQLKSVALSEMRVEIFELMKAVSGMSREVLDLRMELSSVLVVMAMLQFTIIFIMLITCLWHCYNHHSMKTQIRNLINSQSLLDTNTSLTRVKKASESLINEDSDNVFTIKSTSVSSQTAKSSSSLIHHIRSSSASTLSELDKVAKIKANFSGAGFSSVTGEEVGLRGGEQFVRSKSDGIGDGGGIRWLSSSSTSSITDIRSNGWTPIIEHKKKKKSKLNKK